MSNTTPDSVNHPSHYTQGAVECIEGIEAALGPHFVGHCIGCVIKYVWRWEKKNGLEDLKKAQWYLDRAITIMEKSK